jgi:hypothetical protein
MMSSGSAIKATHSEKVGKQHINKSVFNDMFELAAICRFLDRRIVRRSLSPLPGFREGRENRPQLRCGIASQTHHRAV